MENKKESVILCDGCGKPLILSNYTCEHAEEFNPQLICPTCDGNCPSCSDIIFLAGLEK